MADDSVPESTAPPKSSEDVKSASSTPSLLVHSDEYTKEAWNQKVAGLERELFGYSSEEENDVQSEAAHDDVYQKKQPESKAQERQENYKVIADVNEDEPMSYKPEEESDPEAELFASSQKLKERQKKGRRSSASDTGTAMEEDEVEIKASPPGHRQRRSTGTSRRSTGVDPIISAKRQEARSDLQAALARNRITKKRNLQLGSSSTSFDDLILKLKERMIKAATADDQAVAHKKPALAKLRLLSQVTSLMEKKHLIEPILENNLLEAVRMWLEPLPSTGILPSSTIRLNILQSLRLLPIRLDHLRASGGLGRIVSLYACPPKKVQHILATDPPTIRKTAQELRERWMRPLIQKQQHLLQQQLLKKRQERPSNVSSPSPPNSNNKNK